MKCSLFSLILGSLLSCSTMVCISQPVQHETSYIQATATARIVNKFLVEAEVVNGGAGYVTSPEVWVNASKGSGTLIKAVVKNGAVQKLEILNPGRAYPAEVELFISPPTNRAIAKATIVNGFIVGAEVLQSGGGYDSPPVIIVEDDSGNGAELEPIMNHGMISRIQVANPGANYSQNTVIKITPPDPDLSIEIDESHETKLIMRLFEGMDYWLESAAETLLWRTELHPLRVVDDGNFRLEIEPSNEMKLFRLSVTGAINAPLPGKNFKIDYDGLLPENHAIEMIWVEPGTFMMGSPESEEYRSDDETQHEVILTEGFWLGETEVTQHQWESLMETSINEQHELTDGQLAGEGSQHPMYYINWEEAMGYCERLTSHERLAGRLPEGYEYSLPTEAQWEYACRAGTTTVFAYGDSLSSTQANFNGDHPYGGAPIGPWLNRTVEVKSYQPNAWGFYDMHGNVYEWAADMFSFGPDSNPLDPASSTHRSLRGGSWDEDARSCRSAWRQYGGPSNRYWSVGFRLSLRSVTIRQ